MVDLRRRPLREGQGQGLPVVVFEGEGPVQVGQELVGRHSAAGVLDDRRDKVDDWSDERELLEEVSHIVLQREHLLCYPALQALRGDDLQTRIQHTQQFLGLQVSGVHEGAGGCNLRLGGGWMDIKSAGGSELLMWPREVSGHDQDRGARREWGSRGRSGHLDLEDVYLAQADELVWQLLALLQDEASYRQHPRRHAHRRQGLEQRGATHRDALKVSHPGEKVHPRPGSTRPKRSKAHTWCSGGASNQERTVPPTDLLPSPCPH